MWNMLPSTCRWFDSGSGDIFCVFAAQIIRVMASASTDQIELVPLDAAVLRTESSSSLRLAPSDGSNHEPDPHDDTTPHIPGGSSSVRGAVSNFVNSIIGAGIIGLPYAVREAGIITGIALLVAIAAMTAYSARLIIRLGVAANKIDYEALCEHAFGTKGFYTIMAAMFLFAWGAMIGYLVILGDTAAVRCVVSDFRMEHV
jgi:hypothetical protein